MKKEFYKGIVNTKNYAFVYLKFKNEKEFIPFAFVEGRISESELEKVKEKKLHIYTIFHDDDMTVITHFKKEGFINLFGYIFSEEKIEKIENGETLDVDDYNFREYETFDENEIVD